MPTWLVVLFAVIGATGTIFGITMAYKKDVSKDGELRADIKYIARGVEDIRVDMKAQEKRHSELSERVTRVEESTKQAHKRIDKLEISKEEK